MIKVGDKVRVLTEKEVGEKFGFYANGDVRGTKIYTPIELLDDLAGKEFVVKEMRSDSVLGHGTQWSLGIDLVELVEEQVKEQLYNVGDRVRIMTMSEVEEKFELSEKHGYKGVSCYTSPAMIKEVGGLTGEIIQIDSDNCYKIKDCCWWIPQEIIAENVGKFNAGDYVQIKSWEEMESEFGLNDDGNIDCQYAFTKGMKYLCGKKFEIKRIFSDGEVDGLTDDWYIHTDMIKKASKVKDGFNIGDRVRFRTWEDMEAEFGLNHSGNIDCEAVFTTSMKHLCGVEFTITDMTYDDKRVYGHGRNYIVTTDMIEMSKKSDIEELYHKLVKEHEELKKKYEKIKEIVTAE